MVLIHSQELKKVYGSGTAEVTALSGVSFDICEGEFVVILGSSGAGKSTLLNILGGMDTPTSGSFTVGDKNIHSLSEKKLSLYRRNDIGFVFQFYNLMPNLTALENVELAVGGKKSLNAEKALEAVGLKERMNNFPAQLSGGEQQRVAIARAIAKDPLLLLCDEPTGALDSKTGRSVIKLLTDLCRQTKKTVIIVTHNQNISLLADRLIRMQDGKIIENRMNTPAALEDLEW